MNELKIFNNEEFGQVRVVMQNNEPWFVAKDVCDILDLGNSRQALTRLDEDEKNTVILNDGIPGNPEKSIVNEPGLYNLIFGSRKPEAKQFKRWVTHEVLPAIRKTGLYAAGGELVKLQRQVAYLMERDRLYLAPPTPKDQLLRFFRENCEVYQGLQILTSSFFIKYQDWCRQMELDPIKSRDEVCTIILDNIPVCLIERFHFCYALKNIAWKDQAIHGRGVL